jgi:hypothetical protein
MALLTNAMQLILMSQPLPNATKVTAASNQVVKLSLAWPLLLPSLPVHLPMMLLFHHHNANEQQSTQLKMMVIFPRMNRLRFIRSSVMTPHSLTPFLPSDRRDLALASSKASSTVKLLDILSLYPLTSI